jgi:hypothetical protein
MRIMARVGGLACLAVLLHGASAFAGDEALLNGRYGFVLHGTGGAGQSQQIARIGMLVFDGNGHITSLFIDAEVRNGVIVDVPSYPLSDPNFALFAGGTYSIQNGGLGRITFATGYVGNSVTVGEQDEVWDIALTENGKGFDIKVRKASSYTGDTVGDPGTFVDDKLTLSGQARAD